MNSKKINKKVVVPSVLLAAFVAVPLVINGLRSMSDEPKDSVRSPASRWIEEIRSGSVNLERNLAVQVAELKQRTLASIGRPADPLEKLRFGVLEGKYSLTMAGDFIKEISFIDNPNTEGRPATIADRKQFIKDFGQFFELGSRLERISTNIKGSKIIENYLVKTSSGQDTILSFVLDDMDRLFAIHSEKSQHQLTRNQIN